MAKQLKVRGDSITWHGSENYRADGDFLHFSVLSEVAALIVAENLTEIFGVEVLIIDTETHEEYIYSA